MFTTMGAAVCMAATSLVVGAAGQTNLHFTSELCMSAIFEGYIQTSASPSCISEGKFRPTSVCVC